MENIGAIMLSIMKHLPKKAQNKLIPQLEISNKIDAAPAGAILMGMHILNYVGFAKYIDQLLGEEHTPIEKLQKHYQDRKIPEGAFLTPSIGIVLSLLVADMIACPRDITRAYKFVEIAEKWQTGPLLGIEPTLLNDDRIARAMTALGKDSKVMEEVLYNLVMDASKKAGIPLNKFILDTTLLQLSGDFKDGCI